MRSWVRTRRGPASSTLQLASIPTPDVPTEPSSDVLVRVSHVSLQVSTQMMMKAIPSLPFSGPWVPELELSGHIVAAGGGAAAELRTPGTPVIAFRNPLAAMLMGHGVLAEYVRLPSNKVCLIDPAVDMAAASGIHCSGSAALNMIRTAGVREGHRVLVNGASGSAGSLLVQLCKIRGATVVGVASGGNEAMVRSLGADEFIDYRQHLPLSAYLAQMYGDRPFDFILDCVGTQELFVHSPDYLKPDGGVVNIGMLEGIGVTVWNMLVNSWLPTRLGGVPRRYIGISSPPKRDDAIYLAHLIEQGRLRIPVDSVFPMEDALGAYERIATQRARGKVVIRVGSE
ncbi:NAD(P)-binding protein [Aspergillus pseudodeflectus]|uniref:NAD(P)-binding protein n=1 Tax=Aspergillus pseudodeflectus TaxID=176178 RepID=A0ABR4L4Q5_9EURO